MIPVGITSRCAAWLVMQSSFFILFPLVVWNQHQREKKLNLIKNSLQFKPFFWNHLTWKWFKSQPFFFYFFFLVLWTPSGPQPMTDCSLFHVHCPALLIVFPWASIETCLDGKCWCPPYGQHPLISVQHTHSVHYSCGTVLTPPEGIIPPSQWCFRDKSLQIVDRKSLIKQP